MTLSPMAQLVEQARAMRNLYGDGKWGYFIVVGNTLLIAAQESHNRRYDVSHTG